MINPNATKDGPARPTIKLWFVSPDECPLASRDFSVLQAIKSELLSRPRVVLANSPAEADAIVIHEEFSFKEWRYISKLLADPVIGFYPHKTYTVNTDDIASGLLRGVYTSLPWNRFQPEFHRAVPYWWYPNEFVLEPPCAYAAEPKYLATWRGNIGSNPKLRKALCMECNRSSSMLAETTQSDFNLHGDLEKKHYVDVVRNGRFSLCPAGWAPTSWRIYESMAMGVAPVIIADFFVPPAGPDWDSFSLRIPEKELREMETVLHRHSPDFKKLGNLARAAWEEFFAPHKIIDYYCNSLLVCIRGQPESNSREGEVRRWKSLRMRWSNKWTIVQRLQARLSRSLFLGKAGF